jgi:F-type H+-transporting ATPase subunit epsilon
MSNQSLNVEIISPQGSVFLGLCHMVVVPSVEGEIGVMHGHESFVSVLHHGMVKVFDETQSLIKEFPVESGFAETSPGDRLLILIDS